MSDKDIELDLSLFLKEILLRDLMGPLIDQARMSDMGERQFSQFERSIKASFYKVLREGNDYLNDYRRFRVSPTDDILPKAPNKSDSGSL